jgi:PAS domain S-box-containing protein
MDVLAGEAHANVTAPLFRETDVQEELRRAIETLPGLVWSAGPDGAVDFLNQRWCDYTGVSLEDGCNWGWHTTVHADDRAALLDVWRSLLAHGDEGEVEARLRRHDGVFRWFSIRAVPLHDEHGTLVRWYGQNTDIDDRKRAEALLAGEKHLLEMVASGAALPQVLNALCRLVEGTDSACHCSVLLINDDRATVRHGAAPTLPHGYTQAIDGKDTALPYWGPCAMAMAEKAPVIVADISADARWRAFEWSELAITNGLRSCWTTPIVSRAGDPFGTFAVYRCDPGHPTTEQQELTERLAHIASIAIERGQTARALEESQAHLAEAQRLSSTGSFTWRVAKGEITWSEQVYRIYDVDPDVPVTFDLVFTRIHPDEALWFQELLGRASSEGRDLEFEHRLQMPDQSVRHLHVVAHATRGPDGQLEYIGAVQDVSERRRSEDALNRLRSELSHMARVTTLGALTASIAHEVNQPLSGIITNASTSLLMLADDPPNIEGAAESAQRTIRDANRAAEVIARLRTLFRKTVTATESFDLNEATREVLALSMRELEAARVTVQTEFADTLPAVNGDRVQLQQVILNLVLNAVEAMSGVEDRPRHLVVRTEHEEGDRIRLVVRDTGPGFAAQDSNRLFETFYTTKQDGMGIGLSISRSIIERHQGRLWADRNDAPGATFVFSIPRAAVLGRARNTDDPPHRETPHAERGTELV